IGNTAFASAGVTEDEARKNGFDVVVGEFEGVDKHPGSLPNTHTQYVKLIAAKDSGILMGGEIVGGESTGELINVIGLAIQQGMTATALYTSQIGTHPLLTSAPTKYPLTKAAEAILKKK
ncbi:MAG: pyridine nucleotide-disulfide oxidoreductase, partial [Fusobacteriia bacterium 4572_132]